jgi:TRAP-type C4-dicarboxylate transport system permease small subunit
MRKILNGLYLGSGAVAGFFLVLIAVIVLLQVGANVLDVILLQFTGERMGLLVPSYADFAGFFLATTSFLALAYTLRMGGHIRVAMIITKLPPRVRQGFELWCAGAGAALTGYFSWHTVTLVLESIEFGDVSVGMIPVALWIPQTAMLIGLIVLTIALVDQFVTVAMGGQPSYADKELGDADVDVDALAEEKTG